MAGALLAGALFAGIAIAGQPADAASVEPVSCLTTGDDDMSTDDAPAAGPCDCDIDLDCCQHCCGPLWVVNAGSVFLQRGTPHSTPLVYSINTHGPVLVDANVFRFNYAAGADISAIRRVDGFDRFDAIDFRYFGLQSTQANTSINPSGLWALPTAPLIGGGLTPGPLELGYHAQLYSAEFNLRRSTRGGRLTWLAGTRWIQLNEQLNFTGNFFGISSNTTSFNTQNNLYGGQVGAAYNLWDGGGPLSIVGTGKAGIYGNASGGQSDNNFVSSSDHVTRLAFVGDLSASAVYQLGEHIAIRGGWQLLWIQGVATATNQVAATNYHTSSGMNTAGTAFYQGAMGSVTFSW